MRKEYIIAASILIFTIGTILLYFSPDATSQSRNVSVASQKMNMAQNGRQINNKNTGINSQNINSKNSSSVGNIALNNSNSNNLNFSNTNYNSQNAKVNNRFMEHVNIDVSEGGLPVSNSRLKNSNVNSSNRFSNTNSGIRNNTMPYANIDVADNYISGTNTNNSYRQSSPRRYNNNNQPVSNRYNNLNQPNNNSNYNLANNNSFNNNNYPDNRNIQNNNQENDDKYRYENINWNVWKSNFTNRILDDCDYIPSLNTYPQGTWLWISFDVSDTGEISNVVIFSKDVMLEDRQKLGKMIKSHAHSKYTVFPPKSKRKTANVRFIMTIDNIERRSRPEDFHDKEKIMVRE